MLLRHEVAVEAFEGAGAYGETYGPPQTVRGFLDEQTRLVRDTGGNQVSSSSTFYCHLDAVTAPPQSRVTLPDGRTTTVIAALRRDGGGLPTPDHLEVQLT
ncbi:hypothetical protein [Streptomyces sp. Z26]|uniref:hypothetical protein n=1 Tax=Streptomyces sp. Z26 TaxID=2500177 RepID=UPI001F0C758E|nr:hypothetical protein [Streptomyces sp. Z26]